mmetsp:Transcript_45297/g.110289  ORF Transcript_45297/g.110289 Transcript_45297/m.110289 type:complete len:428 (+) Transcript_45297:185-1468(+)
MHVARARRSPLGETHVRVIDARTQKHPLVVRIRVVKPHHTRDPELGVNFRVVLGGARHARARQPLGGSRWPVVRAHRGADHVQVAVGVVLAGAVHLWVEGGWIVPAQGNRLGEAAQARPHRQVVALFRVRGVAERREGARAVGAARHAREGRPGVVGGVAEARDQERRQQKGRIRAQIEIGLGVVDEFALFEAGVVPFCAKELAEVVHDGEVYGAEVEAEGGVGLLEVRREEELLAVLGDLLRRLGLVAVHGEGEAVGDEGVDLAELEVLRLLGLQRPLVAGLCRRVPAGLEVARWACRRLREGELHAPQARHHGGALWRLSVSEVRKGLRLVQALRDGGEGGPCGLGGVVQPRDEEGGEEEGRVSAEVHVGLRVVDELPVLQPGVVPLLRDEAAEVAHHTQVGGHESLLEVGREEEALVVPGDLAG